MNNQPNHTSSAIHHRHPHPHQIPQQHSQFQRQSTLQAQLPPHHHHHHPHPHHHPGPLDTQQANLNAYKNSANYAFKGYVETTHDALIIFQACCNGKMDKVTRRLHERERRQIQSGAVYVFDEQEAGIKRWTDGRIWSPSRILNNFLIYREIDQKRPAPSSSNSNNNESNCNVPNTPATSHASPSAISNASESPNGGGGVPPSSLHPPHSRPDPEISSGPTRPEFTTTTANQEPNPTPPSDQSLTPALTMLRDQERALVGSLTTTYKFKQDGLVKKTISIGTMHMISYYKVEDVLKGRLRTPSSDAEWLNLHISPALLQPQNFRVAPTQIVGPHGIRFYDEGDDHHAAAANSVNVHGGTSPALPHHLRHPTSITTDGGQLQAIITQTRNCNDGNSILTSGRISRPTSSSGSTTARSPISPILPTNLGPVSSSNGSSIARLHSNGATTARASGSTRYEPYPRPSRSPDSHYFPGASVPNPNPYDSHSFIGSTANDHLSENRTQSNTRHENSTNNNGQGYSIEYRMNEARGESNNSNQFCSSGTGESSIYQHSPYASLSSSVRNSSQTPSLLPSIKPSASGEPYFGSSNPPPTPDRFYEPFRPPSLNSTNLNTNIRHDHPSHQFGTSVSPTTPSHFSGFPNNSYGTTTSSNSSPYGNFHLGITRPSSGSTNTTHTTGTGGMVVSPGSRSGVIDQTEELGGLSSRSTPVGKSNGETSATVASLAWNAKTEDG